MTRRRALVIGGTGATGPYVVDGLLDRDYAVTILHGGQHEVEFRNDAVVEHVHTDPHFRETLEPALVSRSFDLVIAQYGRLRLIADVLRGRAGHVVGVGGVTGLHAATDDPRWGLVGRPEVVPEDSTVYATSATELKIQRRMVEAMTALFAAATDGAYAATYVGWPINYGPRQPGPQDWAVVRRILDGRRHIVLADGGLKLESRVYVENAAHGVLTIVDNLSQAAGKRYSVADQAVFSIAARVRAISEYLGHPLEIVDMPYSIAWPSYAILRGERRHRLCSSELIRRDLGFADLVDPATALERTVGWLVENRPAPGSELEAQLNDPFDYPAEDDLIDRWRKACATIDNNPLRPPHPHAYRHPVEPNEPWRPQTGTTSVSPESARARS